MRGRIKITTALVMTLIMIVSIIIPTLKVMANNAYVLTFTVIGNHTITDIGHDGEISIDGNIFALKPNANGSGDSFGTVVVAQDGKSATITVSDGTPGYFNYGGSDYTLYVQGHTAPAGYGVSANENIAIQDYVQQQNPQPGDNNNFQEPTEAGFYVRSLEDAGNIWYKFNTQNDEIQAGVAGNHQDKVCDIPATATSLTIRGEDRTIAHVGARKISGTTVTNIQITNDNFKSENGVDIALSPTDIVILEVQYIDDGNPPVGGEPTNECGNPNSNSHSTVVMSGQRFNDARIRINDTDAEFLPIEKLGETNQDESITRIMHYNAEGNTVDIAFETLFIYKFTGNIVINGTNYPVSNYIHDYSDREEWLDHYSRQMVGFVIENVPKAETYNIKVTIDEQPGSEQYIGNFLWSGNEEDNQNDDYIGHSKLQLVKIVYERNGQKVTVDFTDEQALIDEGVDLGEQEIGPDRYYHEYSDGNFEYGYKTKENNQEVNYDEGSLVVPEGAKVTMRIIPEYGYQVTSFGVNGNDIITGENISEFTFEVGKSNFHLGAQVEEVGNTVAAGEDTGIKAGTVEIANNVLNEGTARLFVENNEDVSKEKVAEFEEVAKDYIAEGYEITNYLDISLAQVFYKGKDDDVWVADELEDTHATMTLQLEDKNFDPENTAIIHNIKDGEEFEEIEFTYDKDNNSITLESDTFSTFAVVAKADTNKEETKTDETNAANTPKTGDNIIIFAGIFAVAAIAFVFIISNKRKVTKKH